MAVAILAAIGETRASGGFAVGGATAGRGERVWCGGALEEVIVLHIRLEDVDPVETLLGPEAELSRLRPQVAIAIEVLWASHVGLAGAVAAVAVVAVGVELLIVILDIHHGGQADLLQVREAGGLARLLPRLSEDGEENGCQNRDDSDNDEQLDQGEGALSAARGQREL